MKQILAFALLTLIFAGGATAQPLSPKDCAEIQQTYQLTPAECETTATPRPAGVLSDEQIESHIFFKNGGARLSAASQDKLNTIAKILETDLMSSGCIKLVGHSDAIGSDQANMALSERRAQTVASYLEERLDNPNRIEIVMGQGEEQLLAGFDPAAREHRRVAILMRKCPGR